MSNATYHERFLGEAGAEAYARKHTRSLVRRLSARRELACVRRALRAVEACGRVLDLPCGAGRLQPLLRECATTPLASDRSPRMIEILARSCPGPPRAFASDALAIALRSRAVEGVVSVRLLHHFPDAVERRRLIAELARVARRFLVLTFLDAGSAKQRLHLLKRRLRKLSVQRALVSREEITADVAAHGFETVGFFRLSSWFSGQTVVACLRRGSA
ncbi:MAG: class I SAM-dependent methyltransferase [Planctomycetota bacterium]